MKGVTGTAAECRPIYRPSSRHAGMWRASPTTKSRLRPPTRHSNLPPCRDTVCESKGSWLLSVDYWP